MQWVAARRASSRALAASAGAPARTQKADQPEREHSIWPGGQLPAGVLMAGDDGMPDGADLMQREVLCSNVGLQLL